MAFTYTCTGVTDEITKLEIVDESNIEVTFKVHGSFEVSYIMDFLAFDALKQMEVGQKVLVATNQGNLMWVKPE